MRQDYAHGGRYLVLLARIDEKVDMLLKHGGDHETRLRAIEKQWWRVGGAGAVLSVIATYFARKLGLS